jgi:ribosomal protein S18 acetylase RimI-like enzyme
VTIEPLTPDDWQTLRDLRLRAMLTDPDSFGSTWDDEQDGDEPWWRTWLAEQHWFVARGDAANPVGMVVAVPPKGGEPFTLNGLWVAPEARGSGRAGALARRVIDEAGDRGVVLTVVDGNTAARNLFTGLGFRPTGERYPRERDPSRWNERLALTPSVRPAASPRPGSPPR